LKRFRILLKRVIFYWWLRTKNRCSAAKHLCPIEYKDFTFPYRKIALELKSVKIQKTQPKESMYF
jgi:hypothetical protein